MVYRGFLPSQSNRDSAGPPRVVLVQSFRDVKMWIKNETDMDIRLDTSTEVAPWWGSDKLVLNIGSFQKQRQILEP
jgi:hypothetical protein